MLHTHLVEFILADILQLTSNLVAFVPLVHRQGNFIPIAAMTGLFQKHPQRRGTCDLSRSRRGAPSPWHRRAVPDAQRQEPAQQTEEIALR